MSPPEHYVPGHYRAVRIFTPDSDIGTCFAVAAPGGQLVGRPDTYETRDAAKARATKLNDIRAAMAPKGKR